VCVRCVYRVSGVRCAGWVVEGVQGEWRVCQRACTPLHLNINTYPPLTLHTSHTTAALS